MRKKPLMFFCQIFLAILCGCAGPGYEAVWPKTRPLGQSFQAYRPPQGPPSPDAGSMAREEPDGVLTLRQALALALMNNPSLAASSWDIRAGEARMLQAGLFPNPELGVEVENFGGSDLTRGFVASETTVQLSQLVELAGKRWKRKRVAALERDLSGWEYEIERVRVFSETTRAFVDVLAAQERLALSRDLVSLAEQVLEAVSERVRAGKVSPVEETRARVSLASSNVDRERTYHELTAARATLAAAWGDETPRFQEVRGDLTRLPCIPSAERLASRLPMNPEIEQRAVEMETRRASVEMEKAMRVPDLTLSGGVRRLQEIEETAFVMGLSIPLPVFDRNQGGTLEAQYRLARAEQESRALYVRVHKTLTRAYERLTTASEEALTLRNEVLPGARTAFEASGEGFRQGKFDYLDVLDAQRTFFEARARYIDSLAELHKAVADVERLTGEPLDDTETKG
jgi:outer membrane protein, heavy metal efflux system